MDNELADRIKNEISLLYKTAEDTQCLHCVYFKWYGTRIGAPENRPHFWCEYYCMGGSCGNPNTVTRLIECMLENVKEVLTYR